MKSHPRTKKYLLTREFHPGMKFDLKENLPLNMMKTYNKISHFFSIIEIRNLHKMAAFNKKKYLLVSTLSTAL